MNQYDDYAKAYEIWTKCHLRKCAWQETVEKNLTDIKGKKVLDIACGTGYSTEILYKCGAKEVVGIDISSETITIAKKKFPTSQFIVGDIEKNSFDELQQFDIVTALFLFEYASSEKSLDAMIKNIAKRIKQKGIFYSLTINPFSVPIDRMYYGISGTHPISEGGSFTDKLHDDKGNFLLPVDMHYWSLRKIKQFCENNGLTEFQQLPVHVSKEGINKYGNSYWSEFYRNPIYVLFKAKK